MLFQRVFRELEVYAPPSDQPPVNRTYEELPPEEKAVYDFFINQENVDKLISFFSLEETKGQDKFEYRKFALFKVRRIRKFKLLFVCRKC